MRKFVIFGAGGHALSIADLLSNIENSKFFFCTDQDSFPVPKGFDQIPLSHLKANSKEFEVIIGVGNLQKRKGLLLELSSSNCIFPTVVHPRAYVSKSASIGKGTVIFSNSYVGPGVQIGDFVIVNTNTVVEHNSRVSDYTVLSPSVTLAGNVNIGESTFIGMGVSVSPDVSIGKGCTIGANSFVNSSIPSDSKAYGSPAKVIFK